jgi:hypothetical protein
MIDAGSVDWGALTPEGRAILRKIAVPVSAGLTYTEVGALYGHDAEWVIDLLARLRKELRSAGTIVRRCDTCRKLLPDEASLNERWCSAACRAAKPSPKRHYHPVHGWVSAGEYQAASTAPE